MASKKRKPGKRKYRKVSFKLSARERNELEQCSRMESTTPNKFIKAAIREKVANYREKLDEIEKNRVSENQLTLFSHEKSEDQDTTLDDENSAFNDQDSTLNQKNDG